MSPEHTDFLVSTFPTLYRQYHLDKAKSLMAWGFSVGDGWFELIRELSEKLEANNLSGGPLIEAAQVKQKFHGLRYYVDGGSPSVWNLISDYEARAMSLCRECGAPGEVHGWDVLCDAHAASRDGRRYVAIDAPIPDPTAKATK